DHDVRLIVIESSSAVRRTLNGIERSVRVVAPDQANEVSDALDEISAELDRRSAPPGAGTERDRPHLVVLIGDLVQLRRKYLDQPLGARLDELLERAVRSGLDVVAFAADLDGAGSFASSAPSRVVGASSNHHELSTLGVGHPAELDGVVGRCRLFPGGDLAQIALAEATTETLLGRRSTGDAS
ncbi:MAG TPA: hypothetical protein VMW33_13205, partial [Ilumatobacteraceae bacterium]|nr:hypothetical protein [Ilumatobacteraceae bacterium]